MNISDGLITRLVRDKRTSTLKRLREQLTDAEKDAKQVCQAAKRIMFPRSQALCAIHTSIKRKKTKVSKALKKKK